MMSERYDVIIIGGGAAGLMAAVECAKRGRKTVVFDKNETAGRKLRITGKGRCNLTNNCSADEVIAAVPGNGRFLFGCVNGFTPQDTMSFFEGLGVKLKTERGRRVFPVSDDANEVADALYGAVIKSGATYIKERVQEVLVEAGSVKGVRTARGEYACESVLVACGGASYPGTGSNGDGYKLAEKLGHTVTTVRASLVPLVEAGELCAKMQGLSLKNTGLIVRDNKSGKQGGKVIYSDFGELLFTHFGLSGPVVLSASAHMRDMERGRYTVLLDLKPALDERKLDARLLRDFEENKNKQFQNSLTDLLPKKMIPVVLELSGIPPEKQVNSITKEERQRLLRLLKEFSIEVEGFRPISEAIVTSGGVSTKEINPRDMQSKLVQGLHFAGEVIDVDAYTGGFNLQIAFSTGFAAGQVM